MTYRYFQLSQPEVARQARQAALRSSAQAFLATNNLDPSYWDPGMNEGIVKGGLILLELNRDLFPDTYSKIRSDIDADLAFVQQHRDEQSHRAAMEAAAKNVVTIIRALAGAAS